ncbi:uncharacterized protein EDB91DRAFT_1148102 [Suillus paluster]|uniref:uncharacterized protein n=1 Tax=Suillus paluster TaxID=48578 RepID=UPI001B86C735|nr:uncharacterized protein EDB91DRAFT_1148102 [Suillus paluster]KAG1733924.1 hypothetical protein EDB91DRAFT_1148102 [Suillus paluster]
MTSSTAHPSAVGTNTQPTQPKRRSTASPTAKAPTQSAPKSDDSQLPPQRHAGAVGLGPSYNQGVGFGDKISGLQEEIKGKIMKKPELVEHGREKRMGVLKKREQEEQDKKEDPFTT